MTLDSVSALNVWKEVNINRSNRPVLRSDEEILYIRDNVGLYQGKVKILNRQLGRVYLTNQRFVYVDNTDTSLSMAIDLDDVHLAGAVDGFLRSSPKVKLYLKNVDEQHKESLSESQTIPLDWVCKICSYNNHLDLSYDINNLPACVSCGIRPDKKYIEKLTAEAHPEETNTTGRDDQCSRCTFINHPSLRYCEMCGSELKSSVSEDLRNRLNSHSESALYNDNKLGIQLEADEEYSGEAKYVKVSFRKGGETEFFKAINEILEKRRWDQALQRGDINKGAVKINEQVPETHIKETGIHKLQLLSEQTRKRNEMTLSVSLEDLEKLMYKAQDLIKLSSSFGLLIQPTIKFTYKISPFTVSQTSKFYHEELARHLSEYLINYKLVKSSSMITLQDVFADYNRFLLYNQGFGTKLVTAEDIDKSVKLFEKLTLPVVLRDYETGLRILRPRFNDNYTELIVSYLKKQEIKFKFNKFKQEFYNEFDQTLDQDDYFKTGYKYYKGNTVSELSDAFSWSNDITLEELSRLVNDGLILIDKTIMGTFYFFNKLTNYDFEQEEIENKKLYAKFESQLREEQMKLAGQQVNLDNTMDLEPEGLSSKQETPAPENSNSILAELSGLKIT